GNVQSATEFADGAIAVADYLSGHLWLFSGTGETLAIVGEPREGPGGFRSLRSTWRSRGDTLVAFDNMKAEFTYVGPDGTVVRASRAPRSGSGLNSVAGATTDGRLILVVNVARGRSFPPGSSGVSQTAIEASVVSTNGEVTQVFGPFPGTERYVDTQDAFSALLLPFGRRTSLSVLGNRLVVATGERPEIELIDIGDGTRTTLTIPLRSREVTQEDIELFKEAWIQEGKTDDSQRARRRVAEGIPFPSSMPPYEKVVPDPSGLLWIKLYDPAGEEPPRYLVVDTTGVVQDTVTMPGTVGLLDVGPTRILALAKDSLDVESVVVYSRACAG
ncbi:MAG: hypothetical protein MUO50_10830, partial [Longimicrobiales bacterium]|nr:hypothetical protein [Longimicrobiales bacterium]